MRVVQRALLIALACLVGREGSAAESNRVAYHLTARPWKPTPIQRPDYLAAIEPICRYMATLQDEKGRIIDPVIRREYQYGTPYFAFTVALLASEGRALDLLPGG